MKDRRNIPIMLSFHVLQMVAFETCVMDYIHALGRIDGEGKN
jgi:hypothetical protein